MKDIIQPKKEKTMLECLDELIEHNRKWQPVWDIVWLTMLLVSMGLVFATLILAKIKGLL